MRHLFVIAALIVSGCVSALDPVIYPDIDTEWTAYGGKLFTGKQKDIISGSYFVEAGNQYLGDTLAVRFDGDRIAMYSVRNVAFVSGYFGIRDTASKLLASYRAISGSQIGRLEMSALSNDGFKDVGKGQGNGKDLTLQGALYIDGRSVPVRLVKKGQINTRIQGFQIIAHRGGGRNSERLGYSENSIEMMRIASWLGATAIEIDVMSTKDGIPIIFHDPTYTLRTVQSPYIIGPVENYTLAQVRAATRLLNGEQIPTLRDALKAVIDSTNLSMVWLDVKASNAMDSILAIAQEMNEYAKGKRNKLEILLGIPDETVLARYKASPFVGAVSVLCELGVDVARDVNAKVWAPRFTAGLQEDLVKQMQSEGRQVYVWTLDDEAFMRKFIDADLFDGVLTNYPTMLAAIFYNKGTRF
ncbi:MAG: glycerophosphodiester phosphodiesterase [Ignavibacteria bacterium]|jgi:glycerophosphoryl diester phosphodiesterase